MIRVTRRYRFAASHRLHSGALNDGENQELYGKCNNPYGHGHNYVLDVTAEGPVDASTGRAVDLAALDGLVVQSVLRDLDHRNLNQDVPEFSDAAPTSENLTIAIEERLKRDWTSSFAGEWPRLKGIRIEETKRNTFERLV